MSKYVHQYQGFKIIIEWDTLFMWGFNIKGIPERRDNWDYPESEIALQAAKKIVDSICIYR